MRVRTLAKLAAAAALVATSACSSKLLVASVAAAANTAGKAPAASSVSSTETFSPLEVALFEQVNYERAVYGLPPVAPDPETLWVARSRAAGQPVSSALTHYDVGGNLVVEQLLEGSQLTYQLAGENLARVAAPTARAHASASDLAALVDRALMQSPTHRANILDGTFDRLAVGVATDSAGRVVFAQIFRSAPAA